MKNLEARQLRQFKPLVLNLLYLETRKIDLITIY